MWEIKVVNFMVLWVKVCHDSVAWFVSQWRGYLSRLVRTLPWFVSSRTGGRMIIVRMSRFVGTRSEAGQEHHGHYALVRVFTHPGEDY